MAQTSRVVTVIENIEVIEVTREDAEELVRQSSYYVQGEKYETLKAAMDAAKQLSNEVGA
jgi:hypothetical protein